MKKFHIDEPNEIGKKKVRVTSKELTMVKDDLTEMVLRKKLKVFRSKTLSLLTTPLYRSKPFKASAASFWGTSYTFVRT